MQKIHYHSGSSFIPHASNANRSPRGSFPRSAGVHFQDYIHAVDLSRLCDRQSKGDGARAFHLSPAEYRSRHGFSDGGSDELLAREPRLAEILANPIVEGIKAADGVDPRQLLLSLLLVSLRKSVLKVAQLTHDWELGGTS